MCCKARGIVYSAPIPGTNRRKGETQMTAQTHNFDPAKAMAYRADVTVDADCEDDNGVYWSGEAFFIAGGESVITDKGASRWDADVEFIGAVLWNDDGTTMIVHGHEGADDAWIERAKEAA